MESDPFFNGTVWAILSVLYKWAKPDFETARDESEKIIRFIHDFVTMIPRLTPSPKEPVAIRPQIEEGPKALSRATGNYPTAHIQTDSNLSDTTVAFARAAAGIAHDIRNPLQAIILKTSMMISRSDCDLRPEVVRKDAQMIASNAERAARIADQLLLIANDDLRLEEQIDLNGLAETALSVISDHAQSRQIRLAVALDPALQCIRGNSTALDRVLMNLLINAIEAIKEGGLITLETIKHEDSACVLITDNGEGIAADAIEHVFDLLYTTKPGGTGLGLWLSRRIVEQHRGTLRIRSELGIGTTVEISLPVVGPLKVGRELSDSA